MRFIVDHDLHIHSQISSCSRDPEQTPTRLLRYAQENGLNTICLTDHFWDETVEGASEWYAPQNFAHISAAKPLPQAEGIRFLFGCETELNRFLTVGASRARMDALDFIIIPTTHFHMRGYTLFEDELMTAETRAAAWVRRLDAVLNMDLPFHKVGLAHLTCGLIAPERETYLQVLSLLPETEMQRLFTKAAALGVGIELNASDMDFADDEAETVLRPYRIAKACGCKFYCGSDAHHPQTLDRAKAIFERAVDALGLLESDKFRV
ncbi:MAG: PHP domain-containing protein [Clostridia bacterium]|nr:PHP domain-containing protein [Clostridia bacterium]